MTPDDTRMARASRALRREQSLRQKDLATRGRSLYLTHLVESGSAGLLRLDDIRSHFMMLGASVRVTVWWNGAAIDRLLDARHALVVDALVRCLRRFGWEVRVEVSFAEYGERGSIDVFAAHRQSLAAFVGEAKSEWGSIEETLRVQDVKTRLAPKLARDVFGFRPSAVGSVLVFPDDRTARRVADRYRATIDAAYPSRGSEVRTWVKRPSGPLRGVWFLTETNSTALGDAAQDR